LTVGVLALQGVSKSFRRGRRALCPLVDVSLDVAAGETVAVIASRGQGKSTLLRVAAGMERPEHGRVLIDGEDLWRVSGARRQQLLREQIGWVRAVAPDLVVPVIEHVAMPLLVAGEAHDAERVARETLERVGAASCAGQCWEELSDWERALVALAHGVVRSPRVLLVDDLTLTLGLGETDEITKLVHDLVCESNMGVLMAVSGAGATHWSDRIGSLSNGELLLTRDSPREPAPVLNLPVGGARRVSS
jgi:predicted ABC-type transport system involved in lysophospholipase L1 biosynthesis ATPase subunit